MFEKECRVCGMWFAAKTQRRQLCDDCQKNSAKVQAQIDMAIIDSQRRLGELPSQQYYPGKCQYCGREFHSYGRERQFCCTECAQQHNAENAVCPICNRKIYPLGIIAKKGTKCCTDACSDEKRLRDARSKGKTANCILCAKEFIQKNDWDEFCCKNCEKEYTYKIARQEGRIAICKVCGKEFITDRGDKVTCSHVCYETRRKATAPPQVECKCEVCGKLFLRHHNAIQYTCSKECSATRQKAISAAAGEKKQAARRLS